MALPTQTFTDVTTTRFDALASRVKDNLGIDIAANAGTASAKGFTIHWDYEPVAETLAITVLKKPIFDPAGIVEDKITKWVNED